MQLLILLAAALGLGYWLSRSRYHEPIDKAADTIVQQPKNWWQRLVQRADSGETVVEQSYPEEEKEK